MRYTSVFRPFCCSGTLGKCSCCWWSPGPALTHLSGPSEKRRRGELLWAVVLWRHCTQSTVARPFHKDALAQRFLTFSVLFPTQANHQVWFLLTYLANNSVEYKLRTANNNLKNFSRGFHSENYSSIVSCRTSKRKVTVWISFFIIPLFLSLR